MRVRVTKHQHMQRIIHLYRAETGETDVDMHEVSKFAVRMGWPLPKPVDPLDRLAAEFSEAAREETRVDAKTGRPYRANHAYSVSIAAGQLAFRWIDIDTAPRDRMHKSLAARREQIVGDVVQLTFDAEHWNSINPAEEPIVIDADFTDDVEWRKNATDEDAA